MQKYQKEELFQFIELKLLKITSLIQNLKESTKDNIITDNNILIEEGSTKNDTLISFFRKTAENYSSDKVTIKQIQKQLKNMGYTFNINNSKSKLIKRIFQMFVDILNKHSPIQSSEPLFFNINIQENMVSNSRENDSVEILTCEDNNTKNNNTGNKDIIEATPTEKKVKEVKGEEMSVDEEKKEIELFWKRENIEIEVERKKEDFNISCVRKRENLEREIKKMEMELEIEIRLINNQQW